MRNFLPETADELHNLAVECLPLLRPVLPLGRGLAGLASTSSLSGRQHRHKVIDTRFHSDAFTLK